MPILNMKLTFEQRLAKAGSLASRSNSYGVRRNNSCLCTDGDPCDYHAATCIVCRQLGAAIPRCKGHPGAKFSPRPFAAYKLIPLTYLEVQKEFPAAWEALPECYQADSCLKFSKDTDGMLWADYDLGGTYLWDPDTKEWLG